VDEKESRRVMATPSAGASLTAAARRTGAARRPAVVVFAVVLGILLSAVPAQAAPTTSAEAARLVAAKGRDLEVLSEKFDTARELLTREEAVVEKATATLKKATATLAVARRQVRGIARSAFTGDGVSPFRALMTSQNATEFIDRVSTLETIAGHQNGILHTAAVASSVAAQAQATAKKAAAAAKAQFDAVASQQAKLKAQIASFQAVFDRLSAQEKVAAVNGTGQASRADRAPVSIAATGPIVANSQAAQIAVDTAMAQRGKPYVWAAAGPDAFDCSGLVEYAYSAAGIGLPHSSFLQSQMGQYVPRDQLQPGDLVFFYSPVSHVGIYIGNGLMVNAPTAGDVVKVAPVDVMGAYATARRIAG
jgi:cell wall-associated NlpC family hydrolase